MMLLNRLMEIRANEVLVKQQPKEDFKKLFEKSRGMKKDNPFNRGPNPFATRGGLNPFMGRRN